MCMYFFAYFCVWEEGGKRKITFIQLLLTVLFYIFTSHISEEKKDKPCIFLQKAKAALNNQNCLLMLSSFSFKDNQ